MNRVEENKKVIDQLGNVEFTSGDMAMLASVLTDISQSLAVLADVQLEYLHSETEPPIFKENKPDYYWIVEDYKSFYSKIWNDYIWRYKLRCPKCGEVVDTVFSYKLWNVDVYICPGCHAQLKIKEGQK